MYSKLMKCWRLFWRAAEQGDSSLTVWQPSLLATRWPNRLRALRVIYLFWPISETGTGWNAWDAASQTFVINIMATAVLAMGNGDGDADGCGCGLGFSCGWSTSRMAYTHCGASGHKLLFHCPWLGAMGWRQGCLTSNKTKYIHIKLIIKGQRKLKLPTDYWAVDASDGLS